MIDPSQTDITKNDVPKWRIFIKQYIVKGLSDKFSPGDLLLNGQINQIREFQKSNKAVKNVILHRIEHTV